MEKGLKLSTKIDSKIINEPAYMKLVGSLIYLTTNTPNLSYAVSFISRFMTTPKIEHWTAIDKVLRYMKGTLEFGILYSRSKDPRLCWFIDLYSVGSMD